MNFTDRLREWVRTLDINRAEPPQHAQPADERDPSGGIARSASSARTDRDLEAGGIAAEWEPTPSFLPPDLYLLLEPAQYDHPRWLADATGIPLDELLKRLEASPHAAKGRPYRERLGLAAPCAVPAALGAGPAPDLFPAKEGT